MYNHTSLSNIMIDCSLLNEAENDDLEWMKRHRENCRESDIRCGWPLRRFSILLEVVTMPLKYKLNECIERRKEKRKEDIVEEKILIFI